MCLLAQEKQNVFLLWSMNMLLHFSEFFCKEIVLLSYKFQKKKTPKDKNKERELNLHTLFCSWETKCIYKKNQNPLCLFCQGRVIWILPFLGHRHNWVRMWNACNTCSTRSKWEEAEDSILWQGYIFLGSARCGSYGWSATRDRHELCRKERPGGQGRVLTFMWESSVAMCGPLPRGTW